MAHNLIDEHQLTMLLCTILGLNLLSLFKDEKDFTKSSIRILMAKLNIKKNRVKYMFVSESPEIMRDILHQYDWPQNIEMMQITKDIIEEFIVESSNNDDIKSYDKIHRYLSKDVYSELLRIIYPAVGQFYPEVSLKPSHFKALKDLKAQNEESKAQLKTSKAQNEDFDTRSKTAIAHIERLECQITTLNADNKDVNCNYTKFIDENKRLQCKLSALNVENEDLKAQIKTSNDQNEDLKAKICASNVNKDALKTNFAKALADMFASLKQYE